jgi:hypothetical protein
VVFREKGMRVYWKPVLIACEVNENEMDDDEGKASPFYTKLSILFFI